MFLRTLFIISLIVSMAVNFSIVYAENKIQFPTEEDTHYLKVDIDRDGVREEISTTLANPLWEFDSFLCIITIKDDGQQVVLAMPIDSNSYNISLVDIAPDYINPFIGLDCHCGMHGRRLILFNYTDYRNLDSNNKPTLEIVGNFVSDRPLIKVKDMDDDDIKEIITEDRDYEINPIDESFISTYKYIDEYIADPDSWGIGEWKKVSVYRTATEKKMPQNWDKDEEDIKAYMKNAEKFGLE